MIAVYFLHLYSINDIENTDKKVNPLVIETTESEGEIANDTSVDVGTKVKNIQEEQGISTGEAVAIATYNDEEYIDLLARLVNSEVGNLNDDAQICTASVVLNRMNHTAFPNDMYGVIYQYNQYAVVNNGNINDPPSEQAYNNAKFVYKNGSQIPSSVIYQAQFIQGSGVYKEIDGEYFCYE